jgi:hypothetical protein
MALKIVISSFMVMAVVMADRCGRSDECQASHFRIDRQRTYFGGTTGILRKDREVLSAARSRHHTSGAAMIVPTSSIADFLLHAILISTYGVGFEDNLAFPWLIECGYLHCVVLIDSPTALIARSGGYVDKQFPNLPAEEHDMMQAKLTRTPAVARQMTMLRLRMP